MGMFARMPSPSALRTFEAAARLGSFKAAAGELSVDAGGTTLVVSGRRELLAVAADGRVRWSVSVGRRTFAAPVLGADGTIYVATFGGFLQAWR